MPGAALRFIARLCRSEAAAGELTRSVGSGWHRLAPRCALPGPRALRPRAAAAASHAASRQRPGTCPSGSALGSAPPPPRLGLPARSGPHCSRLFFFFPPPLSLPPHFFPLLLSFSSFILYSLFPKADTRRSKWEEGLFLLTNSSSAWWWRSWLLLAAPPLLPPALLLLLLPGL